MLTTTNGGVSPLSTSCDAVRPIRAMGESCMHARHAAHRRALTLNAGRAWTRERDTSCRSTRTWSTTPSSSVHGASRIYSTGQPPTGADSGLQPGGVHTEMHFSSAHL
eukprot:366119-Chlamydomonas_euryale.AAC.15